MSGTINWQHLAATLKRPQWIAVILSLGFHGALFAAGPSFSSLNMNALGGDLPEQERRQVPLIELTPEEQSRLPDFSSSPYALFPEDGTPFGLFPPSGSSLPLNPLPNASQAPPGLTPRPTPAPGGGSVAVGISPYTSPRRPSILFPPRRSPFATLPSGPTFSNGIPVPRVERTPQVMPGDGASIPSTPTTVAPDDYDGPTASDLALSNPNSGEGEGTIPLGDATAQPQAEQNSLQSQLAALAYQPENTTTEEAEAALEAWQAELEERLPGQLDKAPDPIEIQLPYVQRLCLDPEPTEGLLGFVALPTEEREGLELFPTVLKSTGYPFLNQEAIAALNSLETEPSDDDPEASAALEPGVMYQVVVKVDYDQASCIDRESLLQGIKANQNNDTGTEAEPSPRQPNPTPSPTESASPSPQSTPASPQPTVSPGESEGETPAE